MLAILLTLLLAPPASAATLNVGPAQVYTDLQPAIDDAIDGDTLLVDPGVYNNDPTMVGRTLIIESVGGSAQTTIEFGLGTDVVSIDGGEITLRGFTIDPGNQRRALYVGNGAIALLEDVVVQNSAPNDVAYGASMYLDGATATVRSSSFNAATPNGNAGGHIGVVNGATLVAEDVGFSNSSSRWGGAIYGDAVTVSLVDCTFEDTDATGGGDSSGGAMALWDSTLTISGSSFTRGTSPWYGGAIFTQGGSVDISDSTFAGNSSDYGGAVMCGWSASCVVSDSAFIGNTAAERGGGMEIWNTAWGESTRNLFCGNDALGGTYWEGGGLYLGETFAGTVRNNVFVDNEAWTGGGLQVASASVVAVDNNDFVGNIGQASGAAIYNIATVSALNNLVAWNTGLAVTGFMTFEYGLFYSNSLGHASFFPSATNQVDVDPQVANWTPGDCTLSNLYPLAGSPLVDGGDPTRYDPDGTGSDVGAFGGPDADPALYLDFDGDGTIALYDCDDANAAIHPAALEICDLLDVDEDCNGLVDGLDPGVTGTILVYADSDGDSYGDAFDPGLDTCLEAGFSDNNLDCDDTDPLNWAAPNWYQDADGDGHGDPGVVVVSCLPVSGHVATPDDCDDADPLVFQASTWFADLDGDGWGDPGNALIACNPGSAWTHDTSDCDDTNPAINPTGSEVCDGVDNDCDGLVDDADASLDPATASLWYADGDGDGFGDPNAQVFACLQPSGHVADNTDCDDTDLTVNPLAAEQCDPIDHDCEGTPDNNVVDLDWYPDADADGYGESTVPITDCAQPPGHALLSGDCDDTDPTINPGQTELCDGIDNDCDGGVDINAADAPTWHLDVDGDGFGDPGSAVTECLAPPNTILDGSDCDDSRADVSPAAVEVCDNADNDCNGLVDDNASDAVPFWPDLDGDGYGVPGNQIFACSAPADHAGNDTDCDDADSFSWPGAPELCDLKDNDCDGDVDEEVVDVTWYADSDGDGFGDDDDTVLDCVPPDGFVASGGDCDDGDDGVNPDADEIWYDGVDQDCDGNDDDQDGDGVTVDSDCDDTDPTVTDCDEEDGRTWEGTEDETPAKGRVASGCDCDSGRSGSPGLVVGLVMLVAARRRSEDHP